MVSGAKATIAVTNPANGEEIARVPDGTAADVDLAATAALAAYPGWRDTPVLWLKLDALVMQGITTTLKNKTFSYIFFIYCNSQWCRNRRTFCIILPA